MRIDLNAGSGVGEAQFAPTELQRSGAGRASSGDPGSVEFKTSVGKLAEAALSAPEVREANVQALPAQVDSGTYHVSNQDIASSLLEQLRVCS
jgi:anti-sigma28 factor (negative regulator of flagellin synthesis)